MGEELAACVEAGDAGKVLAPWLAHAPCGPFIVCVPARNEARRLPALIAALCRQRGVGPGPIRLLLLVNNSRDGSRQRAERAAADAPAIILRVVERRFPAAIAHAGSARRAAMEAGAAWLDELGSGDGVLLATDADATPDEAWIAASCAALAAGADAAGAMIAGDPVEEARFSPRLRDAVHQVYVAKMLALDLEDALDPVPGDSAPRHADHSGGGLALRLAAYRATGGCPALGFREDLALVDAVRRLGGVVRHCPSVRVTVSARMRGRAVGGMASTIAAWSERVAAGAALMAPDPLAQEAHWLARSALRADATRAAARLAPDLAARAVAAVVARQMPDPVDWPDMVPAHDAIAMLRRRLDRLRPSDAA